MRNLLSSTLALLLFLAPVLEVLGQGAPPCDAALPVVALPGATLAAGTVCCSQTRPTTPIFSVACSTGHQCCAPDAPAPKRPLAVLEKPSLTSIELKAATENHRSLFSVQTERSIRPAPSRLRLTSTNALSCSRIQRWLI